MKKVKQHTYTEVIMLRLATVFSGIGAIEHALCRMGLDHKIVFACDNGDVEILTKDVGINIDAIFGFSSSVCI